MNPAIVVIAYNRANALKRLLNTLSNSLYDGHNVPLVISIDHENSAIHQAVIHIAESFNWPYGKKELIIRPQNMGLRNHVIACGDLTETMGSIIMLEDDLVVSSYFYQYAVNCFDFYSNHTGVGGISLYNQRKNLAVNLPFEPLHDGCDVYFMQVACSWGQAWTSQQWAAFKAWYVINQEIKNEHRLPEGMRNWPESSWAKYFSNYLLQNGKVVVYPVVSYTSNVSDPGTHNPRVDLTVRSPLVYKMRDVIRFINPEESINVYDSHYEILPARIKQLCPQLADYDFEVDLYGSKHLSMIRSAYLLSSKQLRGRGGVMSFGLQFKPLAANIISMAEGEVFHLAKKEDFINAKGDINAHKNSIEYFYNRIIWPHLLKYLAHKIQDKFS